jgi:hypothetical protein
LIAVLRIILIICPHSKKFCLKFYLLVVFFFLSYPTYINNKRGGWTAAKIHFPLRRKSMKRMLVCLTVLFAVVLLFAETATAQKVVPKKEALDLFKKVQQGGNVKAKGGKPKLQPVPIPGAGDNGATFQCTGAVKVWAVRTDERGVDGII